MVTPTAYILVGVPGSGKSTWVNKQQLTKDYAYISTDKFVEAYARSVNKTYSEVFQFFMPEAVKLMADEVVQAREAGQDIIWDQTSTTIETRKKKFWMLPGYRMVAVVFETPEKSCLDIRLKSRPGKIIPTEVVESMIRKFEMPTLQEGFHSIINGTHTFR